MIYYVAPRRQSWRPKPNQTPDTKNVAVLRLDNTRLAQLWKKSKEDNDKLETQHKRVKTRLAEAEAKLMKLKAPKNRDTQELGNELENEKKDEPDETSDARSVRLRCVER